MPLSVVLAEDSYLMREGVSRLIETDDEIALVATGHDLESLREAVNEHSPNVVVTDIRMPPTNTDEGIQAAETFRNTHPDLGVVVLSQYDEPEYALKLLSRGAAGRAYLLKDRLFDAGDLLHAIREVAAGRSVIDPQVVEGLVESRNRFAISPLRELSPRELDVLRQMAQGKNNEAIAEALFISVRVVEKHINAIFSKLSLGEEADLHRRVKAVLIYLSNGTGTRWMCAAPRFSPGPWSDSPLLRG
ncbi:MAG TPA: response regulator transcription factor [Candidatus Dormibacteraeota bacterium]|nr:response regulator transcription factor [Candidatus Dormibacteraeota bacterium]